MYVVDALLPPIRRLLLEGRDPTGSYSLVALQIATSNRFHIERAHQEGYLMPPGGVPWLTTRFFFAVGG